jgi:hypothetical protein
MNPLAAKANIIALAIYGHLGDPVDSLYDAINNSDFAGDDQKAELYALLAEGLHPKLPLRQAEHLIYEAMLKVLSPA